MWLNTASFYGKIQTIGDICIHANHHVWQHRNHVFCCDKSQIKHDMPRPQHDGEYSSLHCDQLGLCCFSQHYFGSLQHVFILRVAICDFNHIPTWQDTVGCNPGGKLAAVCTVGNNPQRLSHIKDKCSPMGCLTPLMSANWPGIINYNAARCNQLFLTSRIVFSDYCSIFQKQRYCSLRYPLMNTQKYCHASKYECIMIFCIFCNSEVVRRVKNE